MALARIEIDEHGRRVYEPDGQVLADYMADRSHVSIIRGPIGSGTSSASCYKLALLMTEQAPWPDGVRRSRWAIVRNTYAQLRDTTLATWLFWFPEEVYGTLVRSRPMVHKMRWGDVEAEVFFLALDTPDDVAKLRSFEFTGFWFNEIEYIPKEIFDEAESRTGRYPPAGMVEATWSGVIGDMNAPNEDHWLPQMTREAPYPDETPEDKIVYWPKNWGYFVQPAALVEIFSSDKKKVVGYKENIMAENRKWLQPGYYTEKMVGKSRAWINSRLMNRVSFVANGDPVWPAFTRETHVSPRKLDWMPNYPIVVSLDFGRRPTALIGQEIANRLYILSEFRMYGVGAATFAPPLKRFLDQNYPRATIQFTGDPKGRDKGQADERTAYDIFASFGMIVTPAPVKNNHVETRVLAVEHILNDMWMGQPRIVFCPEGLSTLLPAMSGKYCLEKLSSAADPEPRKDKWSDIADCLQYMVLFLGEGRRMSGSGGVARQGGMRVANGRQGLRRVE